MTQADLHQLVRRRLFELLFSSQDASRRAQWAVAPETIERIAGGRCAGPMSERLARAIAHALDLPEYRVRRVVGLPVEEPADDPTPAAPASHPGWLRPARRRLTGTVVPAVPAG